jgi:hypothetical protein
VKEMRLYIKKCETLNMKKRRDEFTFTKGDSWREKNVEDSSNTFRYQADGI